MLAGLREVAASRFGAASFAGLDEESREEVVGQLARGNLESPSLDRLDAKRAWSVCMRMILSAFYSHPWAWNEVGFGGPAYPRGFMRLGPTGVLEPFESRAASSEDPVAVAKELED